MGKAKRPVSIDGMEFDALISQSQSFEARVPEYSVEEGYVVSDTVMLGSENLSMVLYLTDTPVTWHSRHSAGHMNEVINKLKEAYYNKKPVTVITSDETFTDMAIESISLSKSLDNGYAREIPITFRKVRVTSIKTTTIPAEYGKSGPTMANNGTGSTSSGSPSGGGGGGSSSGGEDVGDLTIPTMSDPVSQAIGGIASAGATGDKASLLYTIGQAIGLIK